MKRVVRTPGLGLLLLQGDHPNAILQARGEAAGLFRVSAETMNDGMIVAWIVMVGMLLAAALAGVILWRALSGRKVKFELPGQRIALPVLSLIGMGVALYMLYVEATPAHAVCGPIGDCNSVQDSPYALILGWLPVGLAGVIGYLAILGAWIWGERSHAGIGAMMPVILFGLTALGTLYSIYLTYLEIFIIQAVCMWCITSAIVMTVIMLFSVPKAASWLSMSEEDEA